MAADFRRLLCYFVIFFLSQHSTSRHGSQAYRVHCVLGTTAVVTINVSEPHMDGNVKFCPYVREQKWSMEARTCSWRVLIHGLQRGGGHLAIERFDIEEQIHSLSYNDTVRMGNEFVSYLKINPHYRRKHPAEMCNDWNSSLNFKLVPLFDNSDYVDVSLQMDSLDKVNTSNQFYLRVAYSNTNICSRGFVMKHGSCFTVRTTDRMAQAAAFRSLDEVQGFLQSYTAASEEMREDWHNTSMPVRLAMSHCGNGILAHWLPHSNGTCSCGYQSLTIPENRMLPGSGNCVAVLAGASADLSALKFQPVACAAAMPTVLSFPAVPPAVGAGHCVAADQLRTLCCNTAAATPAPTQNQITLESSNMVPDNTGTVRVRVLVVVSLVVLLSGAVAVLLCPSALRRLSPVALLRQLIKRLKPPAEVMPNAGDVLSQMNDRNNVQEEDM